ncbi:MAG TPA: nickel pincer cofactor biosynthesis protein LarC [Spirochaetota bacterium]
MGKILYYDCFSGISGDMNLAALIDLGVPEDYLRNELSKLHIDGYRLCVKKDQKMGIHGTRVDVEITDHHSHDDESHGHGHHHHHEHRNLHDITHIVKDTSLSENVKTISLKIFRKIAEAEAKVHGTTVDQVHFHEVGAIDSIVDIVGAAVCIDYLKPDSIRSSSIELGGGFVKCAHGIFPVPAPATQEILREIPVKTGAVQFETTTPTGAAILASVADSFSDRMTFIGKKVGYGIGHRDTSIPNVLRVTLGEEEVSPKTDEMCLIECNIDDMNPEIYEYLIEKLLSSGASDAYCTPIIMKKSRPAVILSVLSSVDKTDSLSEILLRETTTFGIRKTMVVRQILDREEKVLSTSVGDVRIKHGFLNGEKIKSKAEYEDCKKIANDKNISLNDVYEIVRKEGKL